LEEEAMDKLIDKRDFNDLADEVLEGEIINPEIKKNIIEQSYSAYKESIKSMDFDNKDITDLTRELLQAYKEKLSDKNLDWEQQSEIMDRMEKVFEQKVKDAKDIRTKHFMFLALGLSVAAGAVGATGVTLAKHGPEVLGRIFDKTRSLVNK
jgi:amino acid permease